MRPMSGFARAVFTLAAGLYLATAALPCAPWSLSDLPADPANPASISVFCPCHTGDAAANGAVGTDWQGPRSTAEIPLAFDSATPTPTARSFAETRSDPPPAPVPIA